MIANLTREPCKVPADRCRDGDWYCHVHDPVGKFQQQQHHRQKTFRRVNEEREVSEFYPEPVAPLIEDHTLALFAPPDKIQQTIIKKRQSAWKRQDRQTAQTEPQTPKPQDHASDTLNARYAR